MGRGLFNLKIDFDDKPIVRAKKKSKKQIDELMKEVGEKFK